jgi:hypothetical protein
MMEGRKKEQYWRFVVPPQATAEIIKKKYRGFCKTEEHTGTFLLQDTGKRNVSV